MNSKKDKYSYYTFHTTLAEQSDLLIPKTMATKQRTKSISHWKLKNIFLNNLGLRIVTG